MKKYFLFGIHNHQPVGNFLHVFEEAYNNCYLPYTDALINVPEFKSSIHFTGELLNWIELNHPEYIKKIRILLERNQIEILSGGFYEPILPSIPKRDRINQITRLNKKIKSLFNIEPKGMWLAERVWIPELAEDIHDSGIDYLFLDDYHFKWAGYQDNNIDSVFVTDWNSKAIKIIPISRQLRYRVLTDTPQEINNYISHNNKSINCFMDDGERFGLWFDTYRICYKEKYLENFFKLFSKNYYAKNILPYELLNTEIKFKKVYIPDTSYPEMMFWALNHGSDSHHIQKNIEEIIDNKTGTHWFEFFSKYPESNLIHKKMLFVSKFIENTDSEEYENILKAQANDAYWHGAFGGLYLPNLRNAIHHYLIKSEKYFINNGIYVQDIDGDTKNEIYFKNDFFSAINKPDDGGKIVNISFLPSDFCLTNTITRYPEPYHSEMMRKNSSFRDNIFYDWYFKGCFTDHFFDSHFNLDNLKNSTFPEQGDFANQPYKYEILGDTIVLSRTGHVWKGSDWIKTFISKHIRFVDNIIEIIYEIHSEKNFDIDFGVELNFNLLAESSPDRFIEVEKHQFPLNTSRHFTTGNIFMRDDYMKVSVDIQSNFENIFTFPLYTYGNSANFSDRTYQGSSYIFTSPVRVDSQSKKFILTIKGTR